MSNILSRTAALFVISVPLNFLWEVAQMPLYVEDGYLLEFAVHCIIPSLGDGIMVLVIFGVGLVVRGRSDWSDKPGSVGYALIFGTGLIIALVVEWVALHVLERWSYTASMPLLLPDLGIGLVPILQMLILPPVIFRISSRWLKRPRSV